MKTAIGETLKTHKRVPHIACADEGYIPDAINFEDAAQLIE